MLDFENRITILKTTGTNHRRINYKYLLHVYGTNVRSRIYKLQQNTNL